jgi:hypothetical protein
MKFEMELLQLLTVLSLVAKAITCMESTQSNVSDVYVFWLAVTATIHQIIVEDVTGLPSDVIEDIHKAVNFRFNQMVNDAPDDVYHTGFMMDPRKETMELFITAMTDILYGHIEYRGADIIRDLNPLSIERIRIPAKNGATKARAPLPEPELPNSVRRMGKCLLHMLRIEYEKRHMPIANLSIADANMRLKDQIRKFLKAVYPFDRDLRPGESAYQWWVNLDQDHSNDAQPLAVCAC